MSALAMEDWAGPADVLVDLEDGRQLRGHVDDGYGPVLDVFADNFRLRSDLGAGCAAYVDGRLAVDVWGGTADARSGRPWREDTAAVIFSCSKGILAIVAYMLVEAGLLDLDLPIASYWPQFAAHGKAAITVRQAMSHRAGLAALSATLTRRQVLAWDPVIGAIESQTPHYSPGQGHAYHALTYGWLLGEVIKRVTTQSPGRYFHTTIARPLGLRTWIGVPPEALDTIAWMETPLPDEDSANAREAARIGREDPVVARGATMGGALPFPVADGVVTFNDPAILAAEVPGANGVSTARSLARLYAACVSPILADPLLTRHSIEDALREQAAGRQISGAPDDGARWGTGFQLASPPSQPMLGPTSFGHAGAGGQLGFADADHGVGFAYLSDQMGGYGDSRARELTAALRSSIGA